MQKYDEAELIKTLATLPVRRQTAFALAAATRQLNSFERLGERQNWTYKNRAREVALDLWRGLTNSVTPKQDLEATLELVMSWIPDEEAEGEEFTIDHVFVDHAVSTLAYAIRSLMEGEPQEAAWAARRAYEAADQAAIRLTGVAVDAPGAEDLFLRHPIVQRELTRQREDLALLHGGSSIEELERNSFSQQLLSSQEAEQIA